LWIDASMLWPMRRGLLIAGLCTVAALPGACGSDDRGSGVDAGAPTVDQRAELQHIHGLGVDSRSGALYVATHTGLFLAPAGKTRVERVGDSRQDIMGFSVAAPGRFVGSGHPDPSQSLPPNLGLIESRDGGRSWQNISLSGQADFHVLRSAGRTVYGVDSGTGRLMVSTDGGREWNERTPPAGVLDLAIDPGDADRIVVSTERGVFGSPDGGQGWRPLRNDVGGLLAWPAAKKLYVVDGRGQVACSSDGGREFQPVGDVGGQPAAFTGAPDGLYVALADGTVKSSVDGKSWLLRARP
jgi:hypothetical protein